MGTPAGAVPADLKAVFADSFAEPPYGETTSSDVDRAFKRFRPRTRKAGLLAAVAFDRGDQVVGMAYSYPLAATTRWWDTLTEPVPDDLRREDGHRTFGLFELAVRPAWRRRGIATRLHSTLTEAVTNERMLLNSRPEATAAQAAHRAWGYHCASTAIPWDRAALHHVMVKDLGPETVTGWDSTAPS